jgi:hypothetical protein
MRPGSFLVAGRPAAPVRLSGNQGASRPFAGSGNAPGRSLARSTPGQAPLIFNATSKPSADVGGSRPP